MRTCFDEGYYEIVIEVTANKLIQIKADSVMEAINKVRNMYYDDQITLTDENIVDVAIF